MEARLPNPFPDLEPHIPHCQASCTRYNNLSFLVSFQEIHIRNLKRIRMDINIYIYISRNEDKPRDYISNRIYITSNILISSDIS